MLSILFISLDDIHRPYLSVCCEFIQFTRGSPAIIIIPSVLFIAQRLWQVFVWCARLDALGAFAILTTFPKDSLCKRFKVNIMWYTKGFDIYAEINDRLIYDVATNCTVVAVVVFGNMIDYLFFCLD